MGPWIWGVTFLASWNDYWLKAWSQNKQKKPLLTVVPRP